MTAIPSFFLFQEEKSNSFDADSNNAGEDGVWTKVRSRKRSTQRRHSDASAPTSKRGGGKSNKSCAGDRKRRASADCKRSPKPRTDNTYRVPLTHDKQHHELLQRKRHYQRERERAQGESQRENDIPVSSPQGTVRPVPKRSQGSRTKDAGSVPPRRAGNQQTHEEVPSSKRASRPLTGLQDHCIKGKVDENEREKLRLKIWNILFRNVTRTIDELYYMCELDSSERHCHKATELLSTCCNEFTELHKRIESQNRFRKSMGDDCTTEGWATRETARGLAWEVRIAATAPSPVTLLFGSRLQQSAIGEKNQSSEEVPETCTEDSRSRRSEMSFSAQSLRVARVSGAESESSHLDGALGTHKSGFRKVSAWVRKPKILSEFGDPRDRFSPIDRPVKEDNKSNSVDGTSLTRLSSRPSLRSGDKSRKIVKLDASLSNESKTAFNEPSDAPLSSPKLDDVSPRLHELETLHVQESELFDTSNSPDVTSQLESFEEIDIESVQASVFGDEDDKELGDVAMLLNEFSSDASSRWADDVTTYPDEHFVELLSPRRMRACDGCARQVIPRDTEYKLCKRCSLTISTRSVGSCSSRELLMRSLHEKLSSPERRKPSPSETKRRQVEKQATAKLNREKIDLQRQAKLRVQSSRQEQAAKTKEEGILAQERAISERLERAAVAREAKLKSVAKKAENESHKVHEIQFINEMTEQEKTAQWHKRLEDGEKRRRQFIGTIRGKAEKQSERAEAQRQRKEDKERQLREAIQKRQEDAEKRKAEVLEEQRRKALEASTKIIERRTGLEKEREAKLVFIKEREERAEQERQKHLLARRTVNRTRAPSPCAPPSPTKRATSGSNARGIRILTDLDGLETSPFGVVDSLETYEDQLKRLAEEEAAASEHLAKQEMAWKRRAKKCRNRLNQLCKEMQRVSLDTLAPPSRDARVSKAVAALVQGRADSETLSFLLQQLKDGSGQAMQHLLFSSTTCIPALFSILEAPVPDQCVSKSCALALEVAALAAEKSAGFAREIMAQGKASILIDICVHYIRSTSTVESRIAFVHGVRLLRVLLFNCIQDPSDVDRVQQNAGLECLQYCVLSSILLRISEQCAQVKCGRHWMGCLQPQATKEGCTHISPALELTRCSLGLIEAISALLLNARHCLGVESSPHYAHAIEVFLGEAKESSLFRVVTQLVAVFLAVEGLNDGVPGSRTPTSCSAAALTPRANSNSAEHASTLRVVAHSGLRALNLIACLDLDLVQEVLGSPALPFELQQLFRYVLHSCLTESSVPRPPKAGWCELSQKLIAWRETSKEEFFAEVVVLMGFYAQCNEHHQESLNWGRAPTPLMRLCIAPFSYFSSPVGRSILFPTLLSICFNNTRALNVIREELDPELLSVFLRTRSTQVGAGRTEAVNQSYRFPQRLWSQAATFFESKPAQLKPVASHAPASTRPSNHQ